MKPNRAVVEFENVLDYARGGIDLYRQGIDENYIPHGLALVREKLDAARKPLVALGFFDRLSSLLSRVEELVRLGPENDAEADIMILEAQKDLMQASGSYDAMKRHWNAANDASKRDG